MYKYATQPKGFLGVLADSFQLYKSGFAKVFWLVLLTAILGVLPDIFSTLGIFPSPRSEAPITVGQIVLSVVSMLITVWLMGSIYYVFHEVAKNNPVGFVKALGAAGKRYLILLLIFIINALLVMITYAICVLVIGALIKMLNVSQGVALAGLLMSMIPVVVLFIFLTFCLPLVMVDKKGVLNAIGNSFKLVAGNWWHTFLTLLMPFVVLIACFLATNLLFASNVVGSPEVPAGWGFIVSNIVIITLLAPWVYSVVIVLLQNLKLRKGLKGHLSKSV